MTNNTKIALVPGASRGLGKNTALALAKKGVDVVVTYRSSEAEANSIVSETAEIGGRSPRDCGRNRRISGSQSSRPK